MIARLVGTLVHVEGTRGVLDVNGVGYEVFAPASALAAWLASPPATAWVSTHVRDDAITLYGFPTERDRKTFEALCAVNGVGPKLGLATLDTLGADGLVTALTSQDLRALSGVPGIGKKLAQRLLLELESKLPAGAAFSPTAPARTAVVADDALALAMARLGYVRSEIDRTRAALETEGLGPDAAIELRLRRALQLLSGK